MRDISQSGCTRTAHRERFSSRWRSRARPSLDSWTRLPRQYRWPCSTECLSKLLCSKFIHMRFEPSGWSGNPKIGYAPSIVDYIFRWLQLKFIVGDQGELFGSLPTADSLMTNAASADPIGALGELVQMGDAPVCNICGSLMVRSG